MLAHLWRDADIGTENIVLLVLTLLVVDFQLRSLRFVDTFLLRSCFVLVFQLFVFEVVEECDCGLCSAEIGNAEGHPFLNKFNGIVEIVDGSELDAWEGKQMGWK